MSETTSNKEEVKAKAFGAAIWKTSERFGSALVSMIVQIVLARLLTPADFGLIAIVVVFTNFAAVFVQSGMNVALVQSETADELDCSTMFWFSFVMAGVLYAGIFFAAPAVEAFYEMPGLAQVLRVIGIVLFINAYNCVQVALLQRELKMRQQMIATLIAALVSGTTGITCAILGAGVWALVVQMLLQQLMTCLVMAFQVRWHPQFIFSFERLKKLLGFGWKLLASSLLHTLYISLYDIVVGKAFNAEDLGYFSQGKKYPVQVETIIDTAVSSVTLPAAAKVRDSPDDMRALMRRALQVSTSLIAPLMLTLSVTSRPAVLIVLGEQWANTAPIFMVFCIAASINPIALVNIQCFNASGRSDIVLKLEIIKKFIAIAMIIGASMLGDLMILAYTTLLYGLIAVSLNMTPSKKLFGYGRTQQIKDVAFPYALAIVSAAVGFLPQLVISSNLILLFVQPIVSLGSYVLLGELTKNDAYLYTKGLLLDTLRKAKGGVGSTTSA